MKLIYGVILSAGMGCRLKGRIKSLIKIGRTTFIEKIISNFKNSGVENIILVLGYKSDLVKNYLKKKGLLKKVKIVMNHDYCSEQFVSLKLAIKTLPKSAEGIIFTPVDHPFTNPATYKKLVQNWQKDKEKIYVPSCNFRKGHPTIFPREIFGEILNGRVKKGARDFLERYREKVKYIIVNDKNITKDFD